MKALLFALAMTIAPAGQSGNAAIAGTWTAAFEGRTFVRLELKQTGGTITGAMAIGGLEVDKAGAVSRADAAPRELTPIFDITRRGSTMTFSRKDVTDTDRFEIRFLDQGRAELQFLLTEADRKELAAIGVPAPRPIALTKQ